MSALIELKGVALTVKGPTLSLVIPPRFTVGVYGPSGSGKTSFLRVAAGLDKPPIGQVSIRGRVAFAKLDSANRKHTPHTLAVAACGKHGLERMVEVLSALGLWDVRSTPVATLPERRKAACELIRPLCEPSDAIVVDGQLDVLDPWTYASTLALIEKRVARGCALIIATNREDLAPRCDFLAVFMGRQPKFAGSFEELEARADEVKIEVETTAHPGARALADPAPFTVTPTESGFSVRAGSGHELASRLLREGAGDVRALIVRRPSPCELLRRVLEAR